MKRVALYTLIVLITLCAVYLLYVFRAAVILFLLSLFTASAARPVINRLVKRGVPTLAAIILTYLVGLLLVGLWVYLFGYFAIPELQDLLDVVATRYQTLQQSWQQGTPMQQMFAGRLPPPQELLNALVAEEGALLAQALLSTIGTTVSVIAAIVIMLVLSIYWTLDRIRFESLWLSLLPASQRGRARKVWTTVEESVGNYLRNLVIQALIAVMLLAGGYYVIGIDYPVLLGLVGALAWLIPVVGYIFAAIAALLVGLGYSPIVGALAAVYTTAIFVALHELVEHTLLKYQHNFSYLLVVLLMVPLAETYGFFGLLAAPPLAASLESFLITIFDNRGSTLTTEDPQVHVVELRERLRLLQEEAAATDGSISPDMASLMNRLDKLLVRTRLLMQDNAAAARIESADS